MKNKQYFFIVNSTLQIATEYAPLHKTHHTPSIPGDRKTLMRISCNLNRKIARISDINSKIKIQTKVKKVEEQLTEFHRREPNKVETYAVDAITTNS